MSISLFSFCVTISQFSHIFVGFSRHYLSRVLKTVALYQILDNKVKRSVRTFGKVYEEMSSAAYPKLIDLRGKKVLSETTWSRQVSCTLIASLPSATFPSIKVG